MIISKEEKEIIYRIASRKIAITLGGLPNLTEGEKKHIKKNFRFLVLDMISLEDENIKRGYMNNS